MKLHVTVRPTLPGLFDDLDGQNADMIAAGLLYNSARLHRYRTGPTYYSVSQQLVYRQGKVRPRNLADLSGALMVQSGSAHITTLEHYRQQKYPGLQWQSSDSLSATELLKQVAEGKLDYTVADSMAISLFQRIHPQVAVAFDISDEEPVMWYLNRSEDDSLYAAMLDFFSQSAEDGTLARLEEKYIGHVGSFDYVDTRTFLSAIDSVLPSLQDFLPSMRAKWTGGCWPQSRIRSRTGIPGHIADRRTRADDADPRHRRRAGG